MSLFSRKSCIGIIIILVFMVVVSVMVYNHDKSTQRKLFALEVGQSFLSLWELDDNNTDFIKRRIVGKISTVFYVAENTNDFDILLPYCRYITEENMQLYKKYEHLLYASEPSKHDEMINSGKKKLLEFCEKQ